MTKHLFKCIFQKDTLQTKTKQREDSIQDKK